MLLKFGPLLLIAQGLAIGFRAKVFNIGAEGQFVLGAIFASAIPVWFPEATGVWIWPSMLLAGAIGGALWVSITAFWRVRLNANEILVSLMMSLVAGAGSQLSSARPLERSERLQLPAVGHVSV